MSEIFNFVEDGNLGALRKYVEDGGSLDVQDVLGHSFLHVAATKNQLSIVRYLVEEAGVDPGLKNKGVIQRLWLLVVRAGRRSMLT